MTCPYCNKEINDTNKYCNYCGKKISDENEHENQFDYSKQYSNVEREETENHDNQYSYSLLYSNMFNNTINSDEDYLKIYVGQNYDIIKEKKFSIPALLLGPLYLFYRKMWFRAIILILINLALIGYQNSNIALLFEIVIAVYLGIKFNTFYLEHAEKTVEEIKISNPDKSSTELLEICKKKGGTAPLSIIIIIFLVIIFILALILIPVMGYIIYDSNQSEQESNHKENNILEKYQKIENMEYEVPKNVEKSEYSNADYHYYTTYNSKYYEYNCTFSLTANKYTNLYKTPEDYINRNISPYIKETNIKTANTKINNITWKYLSVSSDTKTENYYLTLNNNVLYIIEIRGYDESKISACKNAENDLINSITFSS